MLLGLLAVVPPSPWSAIPNHRGQVLRMIVRSAPASPEKSPRHCKRDRKVYSLNRENRTTSPERPRPFVGRSALRTSRRLSSDVAPAATAADERMAYAMVWRVRRTVQTLKLLRHVDAPTKRV